MNESADLGGDQQRSPEELLRDIEQTREELGDTVQALAEKTDVKARTQASVAEAKQSVQAIASTVQARPVPFAAAGAFGAGLAVGWLIGRR